MVPSITMCGSVFTRTRSLNVPGSISSVLAITYLGNRAFSRNARPFQACRKTGTAPPAQPGILNLPTTSFGARLWIVSLRT